MEGREKVVRSSEGREKGRWGWDGKGWKGGGTLLRAESSGDLRRLGLFNFVLAMIKTSDLIDMPC